MYTEYFCEYLLNVKGRSRLTVECYRKDLLQFEDFFKSENEDNNFLTVDTDLLRMWLSEMLENGYTPASINRKLSSVKTFYRFMLMNRFVLVDPTYLISGVKKSKVLPNIVREKELDLLLDSFSDDDFISLRDKLIISLFYETGIRRKELCDLRDRDVDLMSLTIRVLGKRNKVRLIPYGKKNGGFDFSVFERKK